MLDRLHGDINLVEFTLHGFFPLSGVDRIGQSEVLEMLQFYGRGGGGCGSLYMSSVCGSLRRDYVEGRPQKVLPDFLLRG